MTTPQIMDRKTRPTYEFDKSPHIVKEEKLVTKHLLKQGVLLLAVTAAMVSPSLNSGVVINSQVKNPNPMVNLSKVKYNQSQNTNVFSFLGSFSGTTEMTHISEIQDGFLYKAKPKSVFELPAIEMKEKQKMYNLYNEDNVAIESIKYKAKPKRTFEL